MSSLSSSYISNANSVYQSTRVSVDKNKQDDTPMQSSSPDDIEDQAIISDKAMTLLANDKSSDTENASNRDKTQDSDKTTPQNGLINTKKELTPEQKQEVEKLKARDTEVRAHEQAHIAAAAGLATSAPVYTFQKGPDGKNYAIGGEVNVSFTEGSDPKENIAHAEAMAAAALAPADPSSQDLAVASNAEKIITEEKQKLAEQQSKKAETSDNSVVTENTDTSDNEKIQ